MPGFPAGYTKSERMEKSQMDSVHRYVVSAVKTAVSKQTSRKMGEAKLVPHTVCALKLIDLGCDS